MPEPLTYEPSFVTAESQDLLRSMVRDVAAARGTSARIREAMATTTGIDASLWEELSNLGLVGLAIPEELGGAGASSVELAIVMEELGRRLAPVPMLSSAVLGTHLLLASAREDQLADLLPLLAQGMTRLAVSHLDETGQPDTPSGVHARRDADGWVLRGTAGYVIDGQSADIVVTAATTVDNALVLLLVPGDAAGLKREPIDVLDLTRPMATIRYDDVRVSESQRLSGGDSVAALDEAVTASVVMLAAEQTGGAQQVLDMTTAYAKQRVQFGRPIGSFQAVKHRLAECLVDVESARSVAAHAARVLASGDRRELAVAAPIAASWCAEVYERVSAWGIQLHGGIAFTWDHDAHLYFKRAKASKLLFGDPRHYRQRLGRQLGMAPR